MLVGSHRGALDAVGERVEDRQLAAPVGPLGVSLGEVTRRGVERCCCRAITLARFSVTGCAVGRVDLFALGELLLALWLHALADLGLELLAADAVDGVDASLLLDRSRIGLIRVEASHVVRNRPAILISDIVEDGVLEVILLLRDRVVDLDDAAAMLPTCLEATRGQAVRLGPLGVVGALVTVTGDALTLVDDLTTLELGGRGGEHLVELLEADPLAVHRGDEHTEPAEYDRSLEPFLQQGMSHLLCHCSLALYDAPRRGFFCSCQGRCRIACSLLRRDAFVPSQSVLSYAPPIKTSSCVKAGRVSCK